MASTAYDRPPQILMINPKTACLDVPLSTKEIKLGFNTDIDPNFLDGNFRLIDRYGNSLKISVAYADRTVTISIDDYLQPHTVYQVIAYGSTDLQYTAGASGIRNIFGTYMVGVYESTFTTSADESIAAPKVIYPLPNTVIGEKPTFRWEADADATAYELVLSKSNQLSPSIWPPARTTYAATEVTPDIPMSDGVYYWRIRCMKTTDDGHTINGDWSPIYQFNLDTQEEAPVTDEDTTSPYEGPSYDPFIDDFGSTEVVSMFPTLDASEVKTNLSTVYVRVMGVIAPEDVAVSMKGEHITGEEDDHGNVSGTITCEVQDDGTTLIGFTPNIIQ